MYRMVALTLLNDARSPLDLLFILRLLMLLISLLLILLFILFLTCLLLEIHRGPGGDADGGRVRPRDGAQDLPGRAVARAGLGLRKEDCLQAFLRGCGKVVGAAAVHTA